MPFIPHTPESFLFRSDSKDPATTCRGITTSGRPCRNRLRASPEGSPSTRRRPNAIAVTATREDGIHQQDSEGLFCWRHKEQTNLLQDDAKEKVDNAVKLERKTSLDTLVKRLGILDIKEENGRQHRHESLRIQPTRPPRRSTFPKERQDFSNLEKNAIAMEQSIRERTSKQSRNSGPISPLKLFFSRLNCLRVAEADDDLPRPVRTYSNPRNLRSYSSSDFPSSRPIISSKQLPQRSKRHSVNSLNPPRQPQSLQICINQQPSLPLGRPRLQRDRSSQTQELLALIPKHLSPEVTGNLLVELNKSITPSDKDGYIYMYWLDPSATPIAGSEAKTSLLHLLGEQTVQDRHSVRSAHEVPPLQSSPKQSVLLKIGRARNVHRRMNEWTRQCNLNVSMLRYYPYLPSSPSSMKCSPNPRHSSTASPLPIDGPPRVPFASRVERLIHLELADFRSIKKCKACGSNHREWFEVEWSREAIRDVDATIRRWVAWGLANQMRQMNG